MFYATVINQGNGSPLLRNVQPEIMCHRNLRWAESPDHSSRIADLALPSGARFGLEPVDEIDGGIEAAAGEQPTVILDKSLPQRRTLTRRHQADCLVGGWHGHTVINTGFGFSIAQPHYQNLPRPTCAG
jgi:hypothetical protein